MDFTSGSITINRAVVNEFSGEGRMTVRDKDELKGKASRRTMPMCDLIQGLLQTEYERKKRFQNEFVCTDFKGQLIKPDEVTAAFRTLLKKEGLRLIRFHDIRHTCASLMIAERIPLIEVQHWLGHSTMLTTADLYSHLEYAMKIPGAEALKNFQNGGIKNELLH